MNKNSLFSHHAASLCVLLLCTVASTQLSAQISRSSYFIEVSRPLQAAADDQQGDQGSLPTNQSSDPALSSRARLPLKWLYGWADNNRANTVGSAASTNPLPKASYYLSTGYLPQQISNAYGFNQLPASDTGAGQIIAVIESYGSTNLQSDLNAFDASNNIPATTVQTYYPLGKTNATDYSWAAETSLDVEWAHAMAPGATICVVAAPDNTVDSLLSCVDYAVKTLKAKIVSMSWGAGEFFTEKSYDFHFTNKTVTFVAAAGDNQDTNWPSTSPYVLAVGGTTMTLDTNTGTILSETGWNGSNDIGIYGPGWGGGGGYSQYEKIPQYQTFYMPFTTTVRTVPDVAYNGDPYTGYSVYFTPPGASTGGWYVFGGTSAGTPQWASLVSRSLWTTTKPGQLNFIFGLYLLTFGCTDITSGSNGVYPALPNYDLATGLGSPFVSNFKIPFVLDYTGYLFY